MILSPAEPVAGLGYWIGRRFWAHGYATEAAATVLAHARTLGVVTVRAEVLTENAASRRVLAKLGFEPCGRREKDMPLKGGRWWVDLFRYDAETDGRRA